ncbi:hypothetical protein HF086_016187 [Spodoptera exigua]|uniref:Uncharacterized protein n=1 Tax=Spodoptera exigua TaxID=7107 RepID=A0A922MH85_SPOEX|nr:hypothetical protein HF086_016187 [Spodoptera exigua]
MFSISVVYYVLRDRGEKVSAVVFACMLVAAIAYAKPSGLYATVVSAAPRALYSASLPAYSAYGNAAPFTGYYPGK